MSNILSSLILIKEQLEAACLSRSSGGDPGMIFDEFDAAIEAKREGTITLDAMRFAKVQELLAITIAEMRKG